MSIFSDKYTERKHNKILALQNGYLQIEVKIAMLLSTWMLGVQHPFLARDCLHPQSVKSFMGRVHRSITMRFVLVENTNVLISEYLP